MSILEYLQREPIEISPLVPRWKKGYQLIRALRMMEDAQTAAEAVGKSPAEIDQAVREVVPPVIMGKIRLVPSQELMETPSEEIDPGKVFIGAISYLIGDNRVVSAALNKPDSLPEISSYPSSAWGFRGPDYFNWQVTATRPDKVPPDDNLDFGPCTYVINLEKR